MQTGTLFGAGGLGGGLGGLGNGGGSTSSSSNTYGSSSSGYGGVANAGMSFGDEGEVYSRIEAMRVAKEQAKLRTGKVGEFSLDFLVEEQIELNHHER